MATTCRTSLKVKRGFQIYSRQQTQLNCRKDNYNYELLCKTTGAYLESHIIEVVLVKAQSECDYVSYWMTQSCGEEGAIPTLSDDKVTHTIYELSTKIKQTATCDAEYKLGEPLITTSDPEKSPNGKWCKGKNYK